MRTLSAQIIPASAVDFKSKNAAVIHYLKQQQATQDYCLLFKTPSDELDELGDALEDEYGAQSKSYARHVKDVKIHAYTPLFLVPQHEQLQGYTGYGQKVVAHPVSLFNVNEKAQFNFSGRYHGGLFFNDVLLPDIQKALEDKSVALSKVDISLAWEMSSISPSASIK